MALKPATDFATDADYGYIAIQSQPKSDGVGPDAPQKTDREGVPQWTVDALRNDADGGSDLISVTVTAPTAPNVTGPVAFENLRGRMYHMRERDGRPSNAGLSWSADSIKPASAPRKSE